MQISFLTKEDELWEQVIDYAGNCSWIAGKGLAYAMERDAFRDWERVLVALDEKRIIGFCTVSKTDCIPGLKYTPFIGYLFVDEEYRGQRLSEDIIHCAMNYLKKEGFDKVYLISDHENFYEKYGFSVIENVMSPWGKVQKVYVHHMREYDDKSVKLVDNELTAEEYLELCAAVEFYTPSLRQAQKALDNSLLTVKAVCNGKVVGMGRLIGDGAMYWFIQEVCILPEYQGLGIGKGIVNRMIAFIENCGASGERVTIQLMAAKGKEEFYKKLGFVSRPNDYSGAGMQKRFMIK